VIKENYNATCFSPDTNAVLRKHHLLLVRNIYIFVSVK